MSHKSRPKIEDDMAAEVDGTSAMRTGKRLTSADRQVDYGILKGALLSVADQIVSTLCDVILENAQNDKGGNRL